MRDGRPLARRTKQYTEESRTRSWFHLLTTLVILVGLIAVIWTAPSWMANAWLVTIPASLILALMQIRLFVIYHDFAHGAIFRDSKIMNVFFSGYGILQLTPMSIWRHTHDTHHRDNARHFGLDAVGTFPVLSIDEYRAADAKTQRQYRIVRHPLTIACGYLTVFFYTFCLSPFIKSPKKHFDSGLAVFVHIALIVTLAIFRPDFLLLGMLAPMFIASALGAYLFYAQHTFPGVQYRPDEDWDHVYAALNSSSFMKLNPVLHWFTANIGYHHIHHLNHRIPFYRLPEAMAKEEELQQAVTTSLRPRDILSCLRLQLWDADKGKMVSFAEAKTALEEPPPPPSEPKAEPEPAPEPVGVQ